MKTALQHKEPLFFSEDTFKSIADKLDAGVAIHEMVRNPDGSPADYIFLYTNPAFDRHTGLAGKALLGRRATQCIPGIEHTPFIERYAKVMDTGEPVVFEEFSSPLKRYYSVNAIPVSDRCFATIFQDLTVRNNHIQLLHEKNECLETEIAFKTTEIQREKERLTATNNELDRRKAYNEALINAADDIMFLKSVDGVYLACNLKFAQYAELSCEELIGKTDFDLFPREVAAEYRKADLLALEKGVSLHNEEWITYTDGRRILLDTLKTPVYNTDGTPLGIQGVCRDITDRKRTEDLLCASEANFRRFFESMTDMVVITDVDGNIVYANNALIHTLGYPMEMLDSMHILDLHAMTDREEAADIFDAMLRGERNMCPLPLRCRNDSLLPVETRTWLSQWNGKNCIFGICKDLSVEQEAKQLFERLFKNHPFPMALTTLPERRFEDINDAFVSMIGYQRTEVLGRSSAELSLFIDPEFHLKASTLLEKDGFLRDMQLKIRCKDGKILDGLFSGEVIENQGKRFFLTVMLDVTAHNFVSREMERLSRIQKTLMRLATEFINISTDNRDDAINVALKTMGRLILADRAYLMSYDFKRGIICNTHEWCSDNTEPQMQNLQCVAISDVPEWVDSHRNGEMTHVKNVASLSPDDPLRKILEPQDIQTLITLPLMSDKGCLGFVGFDAVHYQRAWTDEEISLLKVLAEIFANFETRRILHQQLIEAHNQAQAAVRAKTIFLGNMSHEIRTPLNAILGYAQIIGREVRDSDAELHVKGLIRSGNHLLGIINDLLELAHSDGQELEISIDCTDFHAILEDVHMMAGQHIKNGLLAIEVTRDDNLPRWIKTDAGKVRQVLTNLIGNAIKFTREGTIRVAASLTHQGEDGSLMLTVEVADTGCGIRAEDQKRIFEHFTQIEHDHPSKGVGLGLFISRRYARALGGDLTVDSRPGAGSCFYFTFQSISCCPHHIPSVQATTSLRLSPDQPTFRIMVVDDDATNRNMIVHLLKPIGFIVHTYADGEEAIARLNAPDKPIFDLVLMDKCMPEMDGYTTMRRMRKLPNGVKTKVIILTASGFKDESDEAMRQGADGFISKPLRLEHLLDEISRLCGTVFETLPAPEDSSPPVLKKEPIRLASKTVESLLSAADHGDIRQLRGIVNELEGTHAEAARALRKLIDVYDYTGLRRQILSQKES